MLPEGFRWVPRYQNAPPGEVALELGELQVASLTQRVGGGWLAILHPYAPAFSPIITRRCSSRGSGISGVEAWACRHEAHLREQAALKLAERVAQRGAMTWMPKG